MLNYNTVFLFASLCIVVLTETLSGAENEPRELYGVRFLVAVNTTDEPGCIATVATPMLKPNTSLKASHNVTVGKCDHGPLQYSIQSPGIHNNTYTLSLVFHSAAIEDAGPPTCQISWNGSYLVPRAPGSDQDLLPGCYTEDSREGWHLTYYWFHLLDWQFE